MDEGRDDDATAAKARLVEAVLAMPIVRLAMMAREGGPLAVAHAVRLAGVVLERGSGEAVSRAPAALTKSS